MSLVWQLHMLILNGCCKHDTFVTVGLTCARFLLRKHASVLFTWEVDRFNTKLRALNSHPGGRCWKSVTGICLILVLVHYLCVCVCCSAPAEGRTGRPWSAGCSSPGMSWGFWIYILPLRISVSHCPHHVAPTGLTLSYLWYLYGLTRPKQSMDQNYSPSSCLALCVFLGKQRNSFSVSLVLKYPRNEVCVVTNCHTNWNNILEDIIFDTCDVFRPMLIWEIKQRITFCWWRVRFYEV